MAKTGGGHGAFTLVDVVPDVGERVSALTYHGDFLFVGTAAGRVLQYRVAGGTNATSGRTDYAADRGPAVEVSARKAAVTQLEAVPDTNLLIVLADGALSLYELDTLKKRPPGLLDQKNVHSFALNVRGYILRHRLAVVTTKKRIKLFDWADNQYAAVVQPGGRDPKELDLPDIPRTVAYVGSRLFLGYAREYSIVQDETGVPVDLPISLDKETRPLIKYLPPHDSPQDRLLAMTVDNLGIIITANGDPAPVPPPSFDAPPMGLAFCYPYLIAVPEGGGRMEVHASRSANGRIGTGGKDEIVQVIDVPPNPVALVDGRVGYSYRTVLEHSDTSKGRNAVYLACAHPPGSGKIMRLQPVPLDRQVEELLRTGQAGAAQELVLNTAADARSLTAKVARLRIDAGRALLFGLDFEAAFAQLALSAVDPREILAMFPELAVSAAGVAAASSADPPVGSVPLPTIARAHRYPARYFHAALAAGIVSGARTPADAASEAADASAGTAAHAAATGSSSSLTAAALLGGRGGGGGSSSSLDDSFDAYGLADDALLLGDSISLTPSGSSGSSSRKAGKAGTAGGKSSSAATSSASPSLSASGRHPGLEPGLRSGLPDITAIIAAQLPGFVRRIADEDAARAEAAAAAADAASPGQTVVYVPPPRRAFSAEERLATAYEALLRFLRARRAALLRHVRGEKDGNSSSSGGSADAGRDGTRGGAGGAAGSSASLLGASGGAGSGSASSSSAQGGRVPADVAAAIAERSAYTCEGLSDDEVDALFLALDTALLKLLHRTRRWRHLDFFAFRAPFVDVPDAVAFLRAHGKYHTAALLYQGRGMVREALSLWRELGVGALVEYKESPLAGSGPKGLLSAFGEVGSLATPSAGGSSGSGGGRRDGSGAGSAGGTGAGRERIDSISDDELDAPAAADESTTSSAVSASSPAGSAATASGRRGSFTSAGAANSEAGGRRRSLSGIGEGEGEGGSTSVVSARVRRGSMTDGGDGASGSGSGSGGGSSAQNNVRAAVAMRARRGTIAVPAAAGSSGGRGGPAPPPAPARGTVASSSRDGGKGDDKPFTAQLSDAPDALPPSLAQYRLADADSSGSRGSSGSGAGGLSLTKYDGVADTVELLRRQGDAALVFDGAEWLLLRDPAAALPVFTRGLRSPAFPHDAVLAYLRAPKFAQAARRSPGGTGASSSPSSAVGGVSPVRSYLEHVVLGLGSREGRFHTALALEYAGGVLSLRGSDAGGGSSSGSAAIGVATPGRGAAGGGAGAGLMSPPMARPPSASSTAGSASSERERDRPEPGSEGGLLGDLRGRLVALLQDSPYVDAERLLAELGDADVYEERVLLHARRGEHDEALALLVGPLGDHARAIRYCALMSRKLFGEGASHALAPRFAATAGLTAAGTTRAGGAGGAAGQRKGSIGGAGSGVGGSAGGFGSPLSGPGLAGIVSPAGGFSGGFLDGSGSSGVLGGASTSQGGRRPSFLDVDGNDGGSGSGRDGGDGIRSRSRAGSLSLMTPSAGAGPAGSGIGGGGSSSGTDSGSGDDAFARLLGLYLDAYSAEKEAAATSSTVGFGANKGSSASPASASASALEPGAAYLSGALDILHRHSDYISPLALARALPDDVPLAAVADYWAAALPSCADRAREAAMTRQLYRSVQLCAHADLARAEQQHVIIARGSTCAACEKRIDDAVFAALPGGRGVVHYGCLRELSLTWGAAVSRQDPGYGAKRLGLAARAPGAALTAQADTDGASSGAGAQAQPTSNPAGAANANASATATAHALRDPATAVLPLYEVRLPEGCPSFRRFREREAGGAGSDVSTSMSSGPGQQRAPSAPPRLPGAAAAAGTSASTAVDVRLAASAAALAGALPSSGGQVSVPMLPLQAYVQTKCNRLGAPAPAAAGTGTGPAASPPASEGVKGKGVVGVVGAVAGGIGSAVTGVGRGIGTGVGAVVGGIGTGVGAVAGGLASGVGAIAGGFTAIGGGVVSGLGAVAHSVAKVGGGSGSGSGHDGDAGASSKSKRAAASPGSGPGSLASAHITHGDAAAAAAAAGGASADADAQERRASRASFSTEEQQPKPQQPKPQQLAREKSFAGAALSARGPPPLHVSLEAGGGSATAATAADAAGEGRGKQGARAGSRDEAGDDDADDARGDGDHEEGPAAVTTMMGGLDLTAAIVMNDGYFAGKGSGSSATAAPSSSSGSSGSGSGEGIAPARQASASMAPHMLSGMGLGASSSSSSATPSSGPGSRGNPFAAAAGSSSSAGNSPALTPASGSVGGSSPRLGDIGAAGAAKPLGVAAGRTGSAMLARSISERGTLSSGGGGIAGAARSGLGLGLGLGDRSSSGGGDGASGASAGSSSASAAGTGASPAVASPGNPFASAAAAAAGSSSSGSAVPKPSAPKPEGPKPKPTAAAPSSASAAAPAPPAPASSNPFGSGSGSSSNPFGSGSSGSGSSAPSSTPSSAAGAGNPFGTPSPATSVASVAAAPAGTGGSASSSSSSSSSNPFGLAASSVVSGASAAASTAPKPPAAGNPFGPASAASAAPAAATTGAKASLAATAASAWGSSRSLNPFGDAPGTAASGATSAPAGTTASAAGSSAAGGAAAAARKPLASAAFVAGGGARFGADAADKDKGKKKGLFG